MFDKIFAFIMSIISVLFPFAQTQVRTAQPIVIEEVGVQVASQGQIRIETISANPGEPVEVGVFLDSNPGFVGLRMFIGYDSDVMTLTQAQDLIDGDISTFGKDLTKNPYTLLWVDALSEKNYTVTGMIAKLYFDVSETALAGKYLITAELDAGSTFDVDINDVPFDIINGEVEIKDQTPAVPVKLVPAEGSTTVIDEENGYIYGLELGMDEESFKSDFVTVEGNGSLSFSYVAALATGAKVSLTDNDTNETVAEYTVIILGDCNGDGSITASDLTELKGDISGSVAIDATSPEYFALDVNGDGLLTSSDLTMLKSVVSGAMELSQNRE
ncbi:MAG: hypothetical protein IJB86_04475 [Clostridia bacterium]|nr:hypothetical protein [Clostridia bacterium]